MVCDILIQAPQKTITIDNQITLSWYQNTLIKPLDSLIIQWDIWVTDIIQISEITTSSNNPLYQIELLLEWSDGTETGWLGLEKVKALDCLMAFRLFIKITNLSLEPLPQLGVFIKAVGNPNATISLVQLTAGQTALLETGTIWKVFKLESYSFIGDVSNANIEFQYTQNNRRSWTPWMPLTPQNFNNRTIDPTRFFQLRLRFLATGPMDLQDFELVGEFINVTKNYLRTPKLSIRLDCATMDIDGKCCDNPYKILMDQFASGCGEEENPCATNTFYNPYNFNQPIQLYEFLSKSAMSIAGTATEYYKVHPDRKGIDFLLNENQLYNYEKMCKIKVMPVENNFPDPANTTFNSLNMIIGDNFIIHVLRDDFKKAFGVDKRPEEYDVLFFCERNLLFEVQHAYANKGPLHASVYYVLQLRKYEKQMHIRAEDQTIADRLEELTHWANRETILEPFAQIEVDKITNKDQMRTLSQPKLVRKLVSVKLIEKEISSGPVIVAKGWADFTNTKLNQPSIIWDLKDSMILGESRTFIVWVKWDTLKSGVNYNLLHNWKNNQGIRIDILDKTLSVLINSDLYKVPLPVAPNIWWQVWIDIDQIYSKIKTFLYKRPNERDPQIGSSSSFNLFDKREIDIKPFEFTVDNSVQVLGSGNPYYLTNYRLFNRVGDVSEHQRILSDVVLQDSGYSIFYDNMEKEIDASTLRDPNW